jgi:glycine cleavage system H lipoate-binding protein
MTENTRSNTGYGSTYTKSDNVKGEGIPSVLGGQVWKVKPDKTAPVANPCLWMAAGVVKFKNCNNFDDCCNCSYDQAMKKAAEAGKNPTWQEAMRQRPTLDRICRHSLTGRIAKRACAYDFECAACDFDQFFEEVWSAKMKTAPYEMQNVKGFDVPMGYYFHDGHTWVRIESGGYIRVGMDDFALKLLGEADGLDLPVMGKVLDQGKAGWGLRRGGNAADLLSPIDGIICEVNPQVRQNPAAMGESPYEDGWLFMVQTNNIKKTVKQLMDDKACMPWIGTEVDKLTGMIEEVAGPIAADGGFLKGDIFGNLPQLGWDSLTKTFLKS